MSIRLLSLGVVMVGIVPVARAEIDVGTYNVRSFELLDTYDSPFGELVVTASEFVGDTNLSAGSDHWYWSASPWPDHFRIEATLEGDHDIGEPFQRYEHTQFPQAASAMPTIAYGPKAWQVSRIGFEGTDVLDVVLIMDGNAGTLTWAATSGELTASRLLDLADGDQLQFDVITSNPQGMAVNSNVLLLGLEQL